MLAISVGESGERQAFQMTSDTSEPGAWRVDPESEIVPVDVNGVVEKYVEQEWDEKVWEHTVAVFEKVLVLE
jgi:hypothetical protein